MKITWIGPEPGPSLLRALREAGLVLASRDGVATVVRSAAARQVPRRPPGPWVWVTDRPLPHPLAARAVEAGAYDALSLADGDTVARLAARLRELAIADPAPPATPGIIAESPAARAMLQQVWRVARTNMPVLLVGETGSGKEEMAALVHRWSERRGPYLPINCAAIPNELMESELFGHAKGAFSGAVASVDGKLTAARGGTVFLDEIDDTPLSTQVKLLRVLEDGQVTRLGETLPQRVDFRIVAATNCDLQQLIAQGRFGQDLYERLAIVTVRLPRLRDRAEDIPALTQHFIARFYERAGLPTQVDGVAPSALTALAAHEWPGNIRELRNVVYEALVYKRGGDELLLSDLVGLRRPAAAVQASTLWQPHALAGAVASGQFNLRQEVERLERAALELALGRAGGNAAQAARLLGEVGRGRAIDPGSTVRAMIRRFALRPR